MTTRNKKKFREINWEAVGVTLFNTGNNIPSDGPENHVVRTVLLALAEAVAKGMFPYTRADKAPTGWEEYIGDREVEG